MTIVIEGALTTEKVEKAVEQFEKETRIKELRKKFWQLNTVIGTSARQKQAEENKKS